MPRTSYQNWSLLLRIARALVQNRREQDSVYASECSPLPPKAVLGQADGVQTRKSGPLSLSALPGGELEGTTGRIPSYNISSIPAVYTRSEVAAHSFDCARAQPSSGRVIQVVQKPGDRRNVTVLVTLLRE
jgi:hypothetical protein